MLDVTITMMITLAAMFSLCWVKAAVPRPALASPFTRWRSAAEPIPRVNTLLARWCLLTWGAGFILYHTYVIVSLTSLMHSKLLLTAPSVSTNTCLGLPARRGSCSTCSSGEKISVPPRSASILRTQLLASASEESVRGLVSWNSVLYRASNES